MSNIIENFTAPLKQFSKDASTSLDKIRKGKADAGDVARVGTSPFVGLPANFWAGIANAATGGALVKPEEKEPPASPKK